MYKFNGRVPDCSRRTNSGVLHLPFVFVPFPCGFRVQLASTLTAINAIGGAPLAHSASPAMHNAAIAALGMDAVYVPLETADGDEFLAVADAIGVAGASITAPLTPAMFERSSTLDDLSTRPGAVNT